tara:strand:- start:2 stop:658 length:657 start_codon:yes stop_codon:yes gene_type:complete
MCKREPQNINFDANLENVYKLLIDLHNKYDKLQTEYDELKKYVNITKNKINVIEYLNKNFDLSDFDFIQFMNSIQITNQQLEIVFKNDYVDGIIQILTDKIDKFREKNINIPITAFSNKDGVLYIYLKDESSWVIMDENYLIRFIKYFNKNLLELFGQWKENNQHSMDYEDFCSSYVRNMKKVIGGNFEKKNKDIMIKNKLYKYLKVNIKDINTYEIV